MEHVVWRLTHTRHTYTHVTRHTYTYTYTYTGLPAYFTLWGLKTGYQ